MEMLVFWFCYSTIFDGIMFAVATVTTILVKPGQGVQASVQSI